MSNATWQRVGSWHSPRRTVEVEAVDDLELRLERDRHDMEGAWHLAGRLIKQDFARHLSPSEPFVITPHAIDAKQ
jgi:hypothetical protein